MIINSQRTIYGLEVMSDALIGRTYTPRIGTTLNEKFNVATDILPGTDTAHGIKYLAIGTGGDPVINIPGLYTYSQHSPLDASLFQQIPYLAREVNNDIPMAERAKYRLRTTEVHNGISYYMYYLKRLDSTDIYTNTYNVSSGVNGLANLTQFSTVNNSSYLNPVPRSPGSPNGSSGNYISKMTKINFSLSPTELDEINIVMDILYGSNNKRTITEIGICGGLDVDINGELESIHTQIYYHVGVDIDTRLSYDPLVGYKRSIEIGGSEPLYI